MVAGHWAQHRGRMSITREARGQRPHIGQIVALFVAAGLALVLLMRPMSGPSAPSRGPQEYHTVVSNAPVDNLAVANCDIVGNCLVP
jgi:hypothetical protein